MSSRYGRSGAGGGSQDQGERKDEGWESRQGGRESNDPGRRGQPEGERRRSDSLPPSGTNTQGELAGIGDAAADSARRLDAPEPEERADPGASGTDQPPRMGGPLGPDPERPHLPEGLQTSETRGTGAGGFDRGVDAKRIGEVHQGAREEHPEAATMPGEPGVTTGPRSGGG